MRTEWYEESLSDVVIVFIHGILSDGSNAWLNQKTGMYWPEMVRRDLEHNASGIFIFSYATDVFSGSYSIGDAVDLLREQFALHNLFDKKKIIFVCHSMGGIIARRFVVSQQLEFIERGITPSFFLVASPSMGSSYANYFSIFSKLLGNTQAQALKVLSTNTWLMDLDKDFIRLQGKMKMKGQELVEDRSPLLKRYWHKQVVEFSSAARYFSNPVKIPHSSHSSICKPENRDSIQHRILMDFILGILRETNSAKAQEAVDVQTLDFADNKDDKNALSNSEIKIFLCHADEDLKQVTPIYNKLKSLNYSPWMPSKGILPGQRKELAIQKAISTSDYVLVFHSKSAVSNRGPFHRRFNQIMTEVESIPDDEVFVLPVRLEDCPILSRLQDFQEVDLFEEDGFEMINMFIIEGLKTPFRRKNFLT